MASASIRFFMKDVEAVKDADADQRKRTLIHHHYSDSFSWPLLHQKDFSIQYDVF